MPAPVVRSRVGALVHPHAPAALGERTGRGQPGKPRADDLCVPLAHAAACYGFARSRVALARAWRRYDARKSISGGHHGPPAPHRRLREGPRQGRRVLFAKVFEFKKIGREDLEIGSAIYMSDGVINMALLNFKGKGGTRGLRPQGRPDLRRRAPFRHPGRRSRRDAEEDRGGRRQVLLRPRRRAPRQLRAQVQGPRRGDLRHLEERLAGHRRLHKK